MNPLVSIIIPTYNRAHLIGETLDSVLAQTYTNWECIIVDDGSTDNTDEFIQEYLKKDSRFQYHQRPFYKPKGTSACKNYGFTLSKGEYINWFDSDDLMLDEFIEKKISVIVSSIKKVDYILCGFEIFYKDYAYDKMYDLVYLDDILSFFLSKRINFNTPTFFYRRDVVDGITFNENLTNAEDLDFVFRVMLQRNLVGVNISQVLARIRKHESSISSELYFNNKQHLISEIFVGKEILNYSLTNLDEIEIRFALKMCLNTMKKILKTKNYMLFLKSIVFLKGTGIIFKIKANLIAINYCSRGKGLTRFKNLVEKETR